MRLICVAAACLALVGCGSMPPRETARAAVVGAAWAAQSAAQVCADVVQQMKNSGKDYQHLYDVCSSGWKNAKASLLAAESSIDTWDSVAAGNAACAGAQALQSLHMILDEINAAGATIPDHVAAQIQDGLALAQFLVGLAAPGAACPVVPS